MQSTQVPNEPPLSYGAKKRGTHPCQPPISESPGQHRYYGLPSKRQPIKVLYAVTVLFPILGLKKSGALAVACKIFFEFRAISLFEGVGTRRIGLDQRCGFRRELVNQFVARIVHLSLDPRIGSTTFSFLDDGRFRLIQDIDAGGIFVLGDELVERPLVVAIVDSALERHEVVLYDISQDIALGRRKLIPPTVRCAESVVIANNPIKTGHREIRCLFLHGVKATERGEKTVDNTGLQGWRNVAEGHRLRIGTQGAQ